MGLLVVIYLTFIGLGLHSGVMGSIWPVMRSELALQLSVAGILSAVTSAGTVAAALSSHWIVRRFRTGRVVAVSVAFSALSLWGYGQASTLFGLVLASIPLGYGAGLIDAALNNYVATHYEARHMNWLHSFWGLGASVGPALVALVLALGHSYRHGWSLMALIQVSLLATLLVSLRKFTDHAPPEAITRAHPKSDTPPFKRSVLFYVLISVFLYALIEVSIGLWAVSYLVEVKHLNPTKAALYGSLFFGGITIGRIVSGFVTYRFSNEQLVAFSLILCGVGIVLLIFSTVTTAPVALLIIGLGCAAIFPSLIHETPRRFSIEQSQRIIGLQMAATYTGSMTAPPLSGLIGQHYGLQWIIVVQAIILILLSLTLWLFFSRSHVQSLT